MPRDMDVRRFPHPTAAMSVRQALYVASMDVRRDPKVELVVLKVELVEENVK